MSIHTVVADIELAPHEPAGIRDLPVQDLIPLPEPVDRFRLFGPEAFQIYVRFFINGRIAPVGAFPKLIRRLKLSILVQQGIQRPT